jgi:hypothetical protein
MDHCAQAFAANPASCPLSPRALTVKVLDKLEVGWASILT